MISLLLASHIKPWRSASNYERLSSENGLLLSPLYDKLFDIGLITFDDNMKILISNKLSCENVSMFLESILTQIRYILITLQTK